MLGPTNTGKTHLAIERMCAHSSGMIGFPLRLLAREVYDRVVAIKMNAAEGAPGAETALKVARASFLDAVRGGFAPQAAMLSAFISAAATMRLAAAGTH